MSIKDLAVSWRKGEHVIPEGVQRVAEKRTRDMVSFYGRFIRSISIDQLAVSCYLQGVEDAMEVAIKEAIEMLPQPQNYEI